MLLSKFTNGKSISRGILALMGFASSTKKAAKERQESPLYGKYYLYTDFEEGQATRVEVQCERCRIHKLDDSDATYETGTGQYISRTFMCNVCPATKSGRAPNTIHVPVDAKLPSITWGKVRYSYTKAEGPSIRIEKAQTPSKKDESIPDADKEDDSQGEEEDETS
ncbi:hypothetical protein MMC17_007249 [Xylographa soralifera]|nr:hypothetical protein [Xylographa soralifera]